MISREAAKSSEVSCEIRVIRAKESSEPLEELRAGIVLSWAKPTNHFMAAADGFHAAAKLYIGLNHLPIASICAMCATSHERRGVP